MTWLSIDFSSNFQNDVQNKIKFMSNVFECSLTTGQLKLKLWNRVFCAHTTFSQPVCSQFRVFDTLNYGTGTATGIIRRHRRPCRCRRRRGTS